MGVCSTKTTSPEKEMLSQNYIPVSGVPDSVFSEPTTSEVCNEWIENSISLSKEKSREELKDYFPREKFSTPAHRELFPKNGDECNRLLKAFRNGLFITELPLRGLEAFMDEYVAGLDERNFPYEGIYVTAWGNEKYRLLSYRIRSPQDGTLLRPGNSPMVQEYGHTQLSACQYVVSSSEPRVFGSASLPPFLNFISQDKIEEKLREIARNNGNDDDLWQTMGQYVFDKPEIKDGKMEPVNMLQQCIGRSLNYVGAPIWVNDSLAGVICVLHTESNKDPDEWLAVSRVQDASERITNIFSKMEHLKENRHKFDLLYNRDIRQLYYLNNSKDSHQSESDDVITNIDQVMTGKYLDKELAQYFEQRRPSTTLTTTYNGRDVQYSVDNPLFNPAFDLEDSNSLTT